MRIRQITLIGCTVLLALGFLSISLAFAQDGPGDPPDPETQAEIAKAQAADGSRGPDRTGQAGAGGKTYSLFVGLDDPAVPAYLIDVGTNLSTTAFIGVDVWGAAYDSTNHRVLFNVGANLWQWPFGGVPSLIGTMTLDGGAASMVGLAYHNGVLYGSRNLAPENIFTIDPGSLVVTTSIDLSGVGASIDLGGIDADPATGEIYATNDDTDMPGLFRVNTDGTLDPIAPYPPGETDIDGLAVGDGKAFLVTDEPGEIYIFDFAVMTYTGSLVNPWTTSEVFSAGAWVQPVPEIAVAPSSLTSTHPVPLVITQTLTISNTGQGDLNWSLVEEAPAGEAGTSISAGQPCVPADVSWLSAAPGSGVIPGGGVEAVILTLDSSDLSPGIYHAGLCIDSDDPDEPQLRVDISLVLEAVPLYLPVIARE